MKHWLLITSLSIISILLPYNLYTNYNNYYSSLNENNISNSTDLVVYNNTNNNFIIYGIKNGNRLVDYSICNSSYSCHYLLTKLLANNDVNNLLIIPVEHNHCYYFTDYINDNFKYLTIFGITFDKYQNVVILTNGILCNGTNDCFYKMCNLWNDTLYKYKYPTFLVSGKVL